MSLNENDGEYLFTFSHRGRELVVKDPDIGSAIEDILLDLRSLKKAHDSADRIIKDLITKSESLLSESSLKYHVSISTGRLPGKMEDMTKAIELSKAEWGVRG